MATTKLTTNTPAKVVKLTNDWYYFLNSPLLIIIKLIISNYNIIIHILL